MYNVVASFLPLSDNVVVDVWVARSFRVLPVSSGGEVLSVVLGGFGTGAESVVAAVEAMWNAGSRYLRCQRSKSLVREVYWQASLLAKVNPGSGNNFSRRASGQPGRRRRTSVSQACGFRPSLSGIPPDISCH